MSNLKKQLVMDEISLKIYVTAQQQRDMTGKSIQSIHAKLRKTGCPFRLVNGRGKPQKEYLLSGLDGATQNLFLDQFKGVTSSHVKDIEKSNKTQKDKPRSGRY